MSAYTYKIISIDSVKPLEEEVVVLCHGHFNIIHPGHIRYLEYAGKLGSKLIVSIQGKEFSQNLNHEYKFSERDRAIGVGSINIVDQVILLGDSTLKEAILALKPKFLVLGKEFEHLEKSRVNEAVNILHSQGGAVLYHAGEANYALSMLRKERPESLSKKFLFQDACQRQALDLNSLLDVVHNFNQSSLLVIGDSIVDQYVACDAVGMSAEAPVVVVRELESRDYLGGAGIVACHVKSIGAESHFISVVGQDEISKRLKRTLKNLVSLIL